MSPHAATAAHVYQVLTQAGVKHVSRVPVPTVPIAGAVIVGAPQLPEQATATGCAPAEMIATLTVVAAGITPTAIDRLYATTDQCLTALLDDGAWSPVTVPASWTGQDMQPIPAITLTVSVGYPQE